MSDSTEKKRSLSDCRREYQDVCTQLGQLYYQVTIGQQQLDAAIARLKEINAEAAPLVEEERKNAQTKQPSQVSPA